MKSSPRYIALALGFALLFAALAAPTAFASNMGFKKTFTYTLGTPTSNLHWVSLPYFYDPRGQMGASNLCNTSSVDAEDLGFDVNGGVPVTRIAAITMLDANAGSPTLGGYPQLSLPLEDPGYCGDSFLLQEGHGYQLTVFASGSFTVVGSHDNAASISFTSGVPASNLNWVSVPYHFKAPTSNWDTCDPGNGPLPGTTNLHDLMGSFPSGRIAAVTMLDDTPGSPTLGSYPQYSAGGYCVDAFALTIGQGYQVTLNGSGAFAWAPSHY
jgi:hypothetical protein